LLHWWEWESARVLARSREGWGEEKAKGGLTRNLYQRVMFVCVKVVPLVLQMYPCDNAI